MMTSDWSETRGSEESYCSGAHKGAENLHWRGGYWAGMEEKGVQDLWRNSDTLWGLIGNGERKEGSINYDKTLLLISP